MDIIKELNISSKFFYFGVGSLAKAIIFRTLAHKNLTEGDRITAAISGYYSLFHLGMSLMYFCNEKLFCDQRDRIIKEIENKNGRDPSDTISHRMVKNFLKQCVTKGLEDYCLTIFEKGLELRNYVNYAPRMDIKNDYPKFGDCKIVIDDLDGFISNLDDAIFKMIAWSYDNSTIEKTSFSKIAVEQIPQFFENEDLFYLKWCNPKVINNSKIFLEKIMKQSKDFD
jgi:hypothetical protein